jgi:multiple sugar transport system permease protein
MADVAARGIRVTAAHPRSTIRKFVRRKSTVAFFVTLPLITIVACLVVYPALDSISLASMDKSMQHFVGFGNFAFLFKRDTFWMVVEQTVLFAVAAVVFKTAVGFVAAHFVHNLPAKGQRKWRGMLLIPWLIPPAMSTRCPSGS